MMAMVNTMRISLNNTTQNKKIYWKTKDKNTKVVTSDKALLLFLLSWRKKLKTYVRFMYSWKRTVKRSIPYPENHG